MSAADSGPRTRTTTGTDGTTTERRLVTFSLGSDPESAVVRAWLAASAGQGNESRRIRQALVAGLQLLPHLEHIETHLGVLARIEAHLIDMPTHAPAAQADKDRQRAEDDPLTHAEATALAALLDTD